MTTQNQNAAAILRAIRDRLNLTQEALAERLQVSFATVNRWEGSSNMPQKAAKDAIFALAIEAGLNPEELGVDGNIAPVNPRRSRKSSNQDSGSTKSMEQMLWDAACSIRGEKDASKFKDYLLPLLFLKRLSDVFDDELARLEEEYGDRQTALEIAESDHSLMRFYLPTEARWGVLNGRTDYEWPNGEQPKDIGQHLTKAVRAVVKHNPTLSGVLDVVDFAAERNGERDINPAKLRAVVEAFSDPRYRLGIADVEPDFLGRAYEYLLRKFAEGSGQSAGEFFTPTEVGFLMAHIMRPRPGEECHDYACGSAGLLIKLQLVCKELDPLSKIPLKLTGQELQAESYAMARMNGIIHDMELELNRGDTMLNPKFRTPEGKLKTFDIVVANPMWNQPFEQDIFTTDPYDRFRSSGGITSGKGDWAWLQHTFACLNEHGRAAVVLDTGAVTRGSGSKNEDRERNIRQWFVDNDLIDGVILLPDNLFYNTPAAGLIIILNKRKPASRKNKIVLLNASQRLKKGKPKNYISEEDIQPLAAAYLKGQPIDGEVAIISREEIEKSDYNLNPSRWIETISHLETSSINKLLNDLQYLHNQDTTAIHSLLKFLTPFALEHDKKPQDEIQNETEIGLISKNWVINELRHYISKPDYGFTASANHTVVGPKFLRITDIQDGNVNWDTVPYCTCNKKNLSEKKLISDDIVVARIGATTGKAFLIESCPEAIFASYLIRLRTNEKALLPRFLYYFMQSRAYWSQIEKQKGGRLKGGINIPVLSSLCLPVPDQDEQREITKILDIIHQKIDIHKKKQAVLEDLFKTLLHKLITGEVCVSNLDLSALQEASDTIGTPYE